MSGLSRWRVRNRAVDDAWWRDPVWWIAAALATGTLVAGVLRADQAWWVHGYRFVLALGLVALILGAVRQLVRGFREPRVAPDGGDGGSGSADREHGRSR